MLEHLKRKADAARARRRHRRGRLCRRGHRAQPAPARPQVLALTRGTSTCCRRAPAETLAGLLRPTDAVVAVAAVAPVKTPAMLRDNIVMIEAMAEALRAGPVAHVAQYRLGRRFRRQRIAADRDARAAPASPARHHASGARGDARRGGRRRAVRHAAADAHLRRRRPAQRLRPQPLPPAGRRGQDDRAVRRGRGAA